MTATALTWVHGFALRQMPAALALLGYRSGRGGIMDFTSQLDRLQQQVADARTGVQAAVTESRDQLRQRVDQAQADQSRAAEDAQRSAKAPASGKWKQMRADAAAKMDDVKARMDKRSVEIDAEMAATDADMAEADATAAIDYAAWTIDNARLAVLDAIDARVYATTRAGTAAT